MITLQTRIGSRAVVASFRSIFRARLRVYLVTCLSTPLLAGCASGSSGEAHKPQLRIETPTVGGVTLPRPAVTPTDKGTNVYGYWEPSDGASHSMSPGHVHLVFEDGRGQLLEARVAKLSYLQTGSRHLRRSRVTYNEDFERRFSNDTRLRAWHCHDDHPVSD